MVMKPDEVDGGYARLSFSLDQLQTLKACVGESLEALEDWEFDTRIGATRDAVRELLGRLAIATQLLADDRE